MNRKVSFLFFSKLFSVIVAMLLSVLCFPNVNHFYFSLPNKLAGGIWITMFCLEILFSVVTFFLWKKKLSFFDRITPILFISFLFAVSWIEGIFTQYDSTSGICIFNLIGVIATVGSIILSVLWFYNLRLQNKKG